MNNSWTSHKQSVNKLCMHKLWARLKQFVNKSLTTREQLMNKSQTKQLINSSRTNHKQSVNKLCINKLWARHKQVVKKSLTTHEQVMNKLQTKCEQVVNAQVMS